MLPPVVHHPLYSVPLPGPHRFPMAKFAALASVLRARGLLDEHNLFVPEPAATDVLLLGHSPSWVRAVLEGGVDRIAERRVGLPVTAAVARRARVSVGGTLLTGRLALAHGLACNTAGGSHHAFREGGAGFCVFNDVAVASLALLAEGRVRRVLVVDLDVHQGDGTAAILADEPRASTFSMHCACNYPAKKQQSTLDVALDAGTEDRAYLELLERLLPELLRRVRPDLVFYNAGVDPHRADRLGRLALSDRGLAERDRFVLETCLGAGVPVATVLGGGYDLDLSALAQRHAILFEVAADLTRRKHGRRSCPDSGSRAGREPF
ncbi:MAG: histone deacetylase [Geminicoccaceae bacterium]|nr:histone deacetylase [Geminicoccaceae bacterium]